MSKDASDDRDDDTREPGPSLLLGLDSLVVDAVDTVFSLRSMWLKLV